MTGQRKVFGSIVASALLLAGLLGGMAAHATAVDLAHDCRPGTVCHSAGGGSGEVPTPFDAVNQKVELADGEAYMLFGSVALVPFDDGFGERWKAYFEVDLKEHPWLGGEKRAKNPFYPLEGPINYWKQFRGMRIRLACDAKGVIITNEGAAPEYIIQLRRSKPGSVVPLGMASPPFRAELPSLKR
ncbi:MAG: hypothetical protein NDJ90_11840 [Oligoflexia bacterium]|nr:hypothetical protein [Oligoflexia bacterium]